MLKVDLEKKAIVIKFIKYVVKWGYRRSRWFVAPMIRGVYMLADLLNPLFYFSSLRIKREFAGRLKFNSKKTAIFVIYQNDKIPFYVQNVLDVLQKLNVDCVLNINDSFSEENIEKLRHQCSQLLVRRNFGFDFAAYKDTILRTDLKKQKHLVLMNDTLFYFKKDLDKLFVQLFEDNYDVVAFSRNSFDQSPHVQSFLFSISNRVIIDKDFKDYWNNYKPFNNRTCVIKNGEIALSTRVFNKYLESTKIIYNLDLLLNRLKKMPLLTRALFTSKVRAISSKDHVKFNYTVLDYKRVFSYFQETNITHSAAFLIASCDTGIPLKRDIVYRRSFSLLQVRQNLERLQVDKDELDQVMRELESRGKNYREKLLKRFLCSVGVR